MKALDVYTELILSLTNDSGQQNQSNRKNGKQSHYKDETFEVSENEIVKVFLVLQEMKAAGADPDIACYNALMGACARAGDISKLRDILKKIEQDGLVPNSTTWKEILRGASRARDSEVAEEMWEMALGYDTQKGEEKYPDTKWTPKVDDLELLLRSYIREASKEDLPKVRAALYRKVISAYAGVARAEKRLGFDQIDPDALKANHRIVKMITQAANFLDKNILVNDGG
eukprot:CAMPEP_0197255122 /NCGR_PEP_ID=MMETSP1429-20130617/71128_1 /TAXON_ID=49237 /ORGANISM="Chaetoceros  sp., Strain UNC1202" /LENGTH=228 /DNA_ID=CAMNT_0042718335 /DNA_START=90 /DNA_END=779 /DNA_ORIENTATION=-